MSARRAAIVLLALALGGCAAGFGAGGGSYGGVGTSIEERSHGRP